MQVIEDILGNDAEDSIFKYNINPLRLGLMIIKTAHDIRYEYTYSEGCIARIQDNIEDQLVSILDTYTNIEDIEPLM